MATNLGVFLTSVSINLINDVNKFKILLFVLFNMILKMSIFYLFDKSDPKTPQTFQV